METISHPIRGDQKKLFGLSNVIDAFEQIMPDLAEKKNLSPYIADWFADLAILSRALRETEIYQPKLPLKRSARYVTGKPLIRPAIRSLFGGFTRMVSSLLMHLAIESP
jgi:hypothetical protein